ncbi:MAG TPA: hypothetical protein VM534_02370, partial [Thermoanaerobaculia bacterium]|nr:hypothetical protein [Thermoanaerobaculia bacterium]
VPGRQLGPGALVEVWRSRYPVERGERGGIVFGANGDVLFGVMTLAEEGSDLESLTTGAYLAILDLGRETGYPSLLRIWNHVSSINIEAEGRERYRRFCIGRYDAFARRGFALRGDLPAASAVGMGSGALRIYFLASKRPGVQMENPRQVAAWDYPPRYGPRSPSFSRATIREWEDERQIYLSGTASIVGHESRHPGDAAAQFEETRRNIEAILRRVAPEWPARDGQTLVKLYVRREEDAPLLADRVRGAFGDASLLILQADICREELLLEIEMIVRL